jgi:hypothetical protein
VTESLNDVEGGTLNSTRVRLPRWSEPLVRVAYRRATCCDRADWMTRAQAVEVALLAHGRAYLLVASAVRHPRA